VEIRCIVLHKTKLSEICVEGEKIIANLIVATIAAVGAKAVLGFHFYFFGRGGRDGLDPL